LAAESRQLLGGASDKPQAINVDDPQLLAEIRRLLSAGSGPRHTVREIAARYLVSVKFQNLKNKAGEEIKFRLHLLPWLGDDIAANLDFDRLAWYREQRKTEKVMNGRDKPPSDAQVNRELMQLSAMCTWAATNRPPLLQANPIRGFPMVQENSERATMPGADDVERIMLASGKRLRAMVATKFWGGQRRQELLNQLLDNVDWDEGLLVMHGRDTKTKDPRVTVFPDVASRMVSEYLEEREAAGIKSHLLFCTRSGRAVSARNFLRDFQETALRAGVKAAEGENLWLHDLRAGFVGYQLELGTPERVIMKMTGHSTHKAFDRYVRVKAKWISVVKERADLHERERKAARRAPKRRETVGSEATSVNPASKNISQRVK